MGILLGAFGDMLQTGGDILDSRMKEDAQIRKEEATASAQEARDIRRDELAEKRAIATAQLKEEFARNSEQAKYTRLNNESDAIEKEAGNIDLKRSGGLINSIRNQVPNEGEFANKAISPEDIETIRANMSSADAEKFYGVKPKTALSAVDDQIAAARNVSAYESRPALIEQRKSLFETDKADRSERQKAEELKRKSAKDEKDADHKERIADAKDEQNRIMMARVAGALSKVGSGQGNTDFDKKVRLLNEAGASKQDIANFITEKKQPSLEDLANGFMKADPNVGTKKALQPSEAYEKAKTLRSLTSSTKTDEPPKPSAEPKASNSTAPASKAEYDRLPKGSVFTAPDGTRRVKP